MKDFNSLYVSVIIPCYNEDMVIERTYKEIKNILLQKNYKHEIIFVDDGSTDKTLNQLIQISKNDKNVKIIKFSRNYGEQPAISAGINNCSGDVAIVIEADLQDPPELIPKMIQKYIENHCNVVYGVRKKRVGDNFIKKNTAKFYYKILNKLSDVSLPLNAADFRLIDRKVINSFNNLNEKNKYILGLISWIGFKQEPIYYTRAKRFAGNTKYSLTKMLKLATTGFIYFTKKPLKSVMFIGFTSVFSSLVFIIYIVIARLTNNLKYVSWWWGIIIAVIFFSGVQLISLGIIGEYIGSIFDEIKNRPEYIIDEKINF